MRIREYLRKKALGIVGLIDAGIDPRTRDERLTFVNDIDEMQRQKLNEYNVWYVGDGQELLNFYTRSDSIDFNMDPIYTRNKKSYFWSVSSTETDIKRTHSGQPRNIVDTLVSIIGSPRMGIGDQDGPLSPADKRLKKILKDNRFQHMLTQKARPMTLVEGWGAWKINWDSSVRDTPIILYYRAEAVDFIYRYGNALAAIVYKDYYQDERKRNYILFETRRKSHRETEEFGDAPCLIIEKELFRIEGDADEMRKVPLSDLPQLKDVQETIVVDNYTGFLGCPCIYFEDSTEDCYGRSVFTGKIDLFDDLDQCLSQSANAVRRSTVHEYFNTLYLEKDERTGMPKEPHDFDRKYILFKGAKNGDGSMNGSTPVQVTQPAIDFSQYSAEEQNILVHAISGVMSTATLGIDVAKRDNGVAEREKEKVTIFTRNTIIEEERAELLDLLREAMIADEFMRKGYITVQDYDVYVRYDEFADASFESKLEAIITGWQSGMMSDEMAVDYLYKGESAGIRKRELAFLKEQRELQNSAGGMSPDALGAMGAEMGGMENNPYDEAREKADIGSAQEDAGVPDLTDYGKIHK